VNVSSAAVDEPKRDLLATSDAGPAAIRGGVLRVGGYVAGALLSAVSATLLLRHLGPVVFGFYITAQSLVAIVDGVSDLGLTAVGVRELSLREGPGRATFARNLLGLRIAGTLVGILGMLAYGVLVNYRTVVLQGVVIAGVGLLLQCCQASLAISLTSRLRLGWVTVIELCRQVVLTTGIVLLVLTGAGMLPFLAVTIPAAAVALGVTAKLVHGDVPLRPSFDRGEWQAMLSVILPYSAAVAASVLYFRMAVIVMSLLASAREVGEFGAAFRVSEALLAIPGLAISVAFPIFARAARDDRDRLGYAVKRVFQVNLLVGTYVALGLIVGASLAIDILAGPKYHSADTILAIQGIGVGANFVNVMWGQALLSLNRLRTILAFNAGILACGTTLVIVLVLLDGAEGAAAGTSFIEVASAVVGGIIVARADHRLSVPAQLLPRCALAAVLGACALLVPVGTIAQLVIMTVLYGGALVALRLVPEEALQELRRLRGQRRVSS
jgi:O-antigen/teichoic acid export membrane protein